MIPNDWSVTWHFGKYELTWYKKKLTTYIPIHILIGMFFSYLPFLGIAFYIDKLPWLFVVFIWILSLAVGCVNEYTQIDYGIGFKQMLNDVEYRQKRLLGHIRDVITYAIFTGSIFLVKGLWW